MTSRVCRRLPHYSQTVRSTEKTKPFSIRRVEVGPVPTIEGLLHDLERDLHTNEKHLFLHEERQPENDVLAGLQLSPLTDPRLIEARERYRGKKRSRDVNNPTRFQIALEQNPYAKILATPIRTCNLTGIRLPREFFVPFQLRQSPHTQRLWQLPNQEAYHLGKSKDLRLPATIEKVYVPSSDGPLEQGPPHDDSKQVNDVFSDITSDINPPTRISSNSTPHNQNEEDYLKRSISQESDSELKGEAEPSRISPLQPSSTVPKSSSLTTQANSKITRVMRWDYVSHNYLVSHCRVIDAIASLREYNYNRTIPIRWRERFGIRAKNIIWRKDMGRLVLEMLRAKIRQMLFGFEISKVKYITKLRHYDEHESETLVHKGNQKRHAFGRIAAVLWIGSPDAHIPLAPNSVKGQQYGSVPLLPYTVLINKHEIIPVFDLCALLGENQMEILKEDCQLYRDEDFLIVRNKQSVLKLRMLLWKLMGYLYTEEKDSVIRSEDTLTLRYIRWRINEFGRTAHSSSRNRTYGTSLSSSGGAEEPNDQSKTTPAG